MSTPCTRDGCTARETGTCLEGFASPEECPFSGQSAKPTEAKSDDPVALQGGDALTLDEAAVLCRSGHTKVVLLAGPKGSGKTTIITSIYESFQEAPYGGYLFAGSQTLVGFERRCYLGRAASGGATADTGRTSANAGVQFLHLRVGRLNSDAPATNVLIADVSGEIFRQVRDSDEAQRLLPFLERVDNLAIVLDGARLAKPTERQLPRNDARSLLRAFVESNRVHPACRIDVIFAKWDRLDQESGESKSFLDETRATLRKACTENELSFFEVAARPEAPSPPFAFGMATLLREWVDPPTVVAKPVLSLSDPNKIRREAERYSSRLRGSAILEAFDVQRY